MLDRAKLFICSGMLLLPLGVGCAGIGSQHGSVASFNSQAGTLPSRERMIVIAKTYEEQGHKQRALTTYRQIAKRYPRSEQGEYARNRILALNGTGDQKDTSRAAERTMLADSASRQTAPETDGQLKKGKEQTETAKLEEAPFPELPLPEQVAEVSEENETRGLPIKSNSVISGNSKTGENEFDENAKWPEWSRGKLASATPEVESVKESTDFPVINPAPSSHSKREHHEEHLSPPAASLADAPSEEQEASLDDEEPTVSAEIADLSSEDRQADRTEVENKEGGWVTSRKETASVSTVSSPEVSIETEPETDLEVDEVDTGKQEQINHRLAALAYLVGNEEFVKEDALKSLELLLDHEDQHVRINSAEALFRHQRGSEKAMQAITSAFSSSDESIRFIAVHALVSAYEQLPDETVRVMVSQLDTESTSVQRQIALLLGDFRGHASTLVPRLQQMVEAHPDDEVRKAAQLSLVCLKE